MVKLTGVRRAIRGFGAAIAGLAIASGFAAVTPAGPTFADFLTSSGAIVAAGLTTAAIEVIKAGIPAIGQRISGAFLAFVGTAVLYAITGLAVGVETPDQGLTVFTSWLTCATSAIGIKSVTGHIANVRAGTAGTPDAAPTGGTSTGGENPE